MGLCLYGSCRSSDSAEFRPAQAGQERGASGAEFGCENIDADLRPYGGSGGETETTGCRRSRAWRENVLDISPKGIHKWSGLQRLGVKEGEYVAFGNDANDITMFQHAAHAVMIGDHPLLAPYASEHLPLDRDIEHAITERRRRSDVNIFATSV